MKTVQPSLFRSPDLVSRFGSASGPEEAIRLVGALLVSAGAATPEHVEAAVQREFEHPTGLPARVPFALVHTDAPGALLLAASLGIFEKPVPFRRMDDPNEVLQVRLVLMLTVPERHMQAELLSRLITALARPNVAERLLALPPEAAYMWLVEQAA
jgi:PTS system galactitol-specific IIA component